MVRATLPVGVDVGTARTRVVLVEMRGDAPVLAAAAAHPTADDPSVAIASAWRELRTRERRCVLALAQPDAVLRSVTFPAMGTRERERAARFEAARFTAIAARDATIRVVPAGGSRFVVAAARRTALDARIAAAKRAGLRPLAVDDAAFALLRAYPGVDAVVDVGASATTLIVASQPIPFVDVVAPGGSALSGALAESLGIDAATADERKRTLGLGGAAEAAAEAQINALASALVAHRAAARDVRSIALTGNGARLARFAAALERAVAVPAALEPLEAASAYPADVLRFASADWALAYGLALWTHAA